MFFFVCFESVLVLGVIIVRARTQFPIILMTLCPLFRCVFDVQVSSKKFQVKVFDKSRTYHFTGMRAFFFFFDLCVTFKDFCLQFFRVLLSFCLLFTSSFPLVFLLLTNTDPQGAERWIKVIDMFTNAQRAYLKTSMAKAP